MGRYIDMARETGQGSLTESIKSLDEAAGFRLVVVVTFLVVAVHRDVT